MRMPRQQTGQLFQRHGGWYVRFYEDRVIDGSVKRVRVSKRIGDVRTRSKTAPEEIRRAAKHLVEPANDPQIASELVTLIGDFVERVYFPRIEQHKRPSTIKGYRHIWRIHLKPRCSNVWMKDVRCHHVQQWLDSIARPGDLGKRTLQHIKCCLSAIFKLAKQQGYFVGENPVRDSAVAPDANAPQLTHAYSLDEIQSILAVLPEPAATIFATAAFTGLRRGEIRTQMGRLSRRYVSS